MEQVFEAFENGNASIEINLATHDEYHIRTMMGAGYIILYANKDELIQLRNKLTQMIDD